MHARYLSLILGCWLGAASATCSRPASSTGADAAAAPSYATRGTIKAIDAGKKTALIAHEDIPGFMKAMTMEFDLRDASVARGIAVGDTVKFTFTDEGKGRLVVQSMEKALK